MVTADQISPSLQRLAFQNEESGINTAFLAAIATQLGFQAPAHDQLAPASELTADPSHRPSAPSLPIHEGQQLLEMLELDVPMNEPEFCSFVDEPFPRAIPVVRHAEKEGLYAPVCPKRSCKLTLLTKSDDGEIKKLAQPVGGKRSRKTTHCAICRASVPHSVQYVECNRPIGRSSLRKSVSASQLPSKPSAQVKHD
eukprot:TRINITY_DN12044_c0_g1_i1.p6 TRINITY_DN12044_c0_g1~~TRINITY_DN12044_c0_g1_i1.p6  ORF type:complete len:197 (+),score=26.36 TRINITY_DN12044_c0_g1_i1:3175-3765(+)